ncbi:MAG: hypothetical protein HQK90_06885 [Nitrospirae bacterium]|nr:hypothetical protein [Nitrospirota bacterium]
MRKNFLSIITTLSVFISIFNVFSAYGAIDNEKSGFCNITTKIIEKGKDIDCKGENITSSELEKLIKNSANNKKLHANELYIKNAIVVGDLILKNVRIPYELFLINFTFNDNVDFSNSVFEKKIIFTSSTFKKEANFNAIKSAYSVFFDNVTFDGSVDFVASNIDVDFNLQKAKFLKENANVSFNSMKIGGNALLNYALFNVCVNFARADIKGNLQLSGAKFTSTEKLNDSYKGTDGKYSYFFSGMKVGGGAFFNNTNFKGNFYMKDSYFESVYFDNITYGCNINDKEDNYSDKINLTGMTYKHIYGIEDEKERDKLLKRTEFSKDVYTTMETYFKNMGENDIANEIYVKMKNKETERLSWSGTKFLNTLNSYLTGHGRVFKKLCHEV